MRALLLLSALAAAALAPQAAAQEPREPPRVEWTEPPFDVPAALRDSIRFGWLHVPQDHDSADGRTLRLALALVKARSASPASDPIVVIPGGPGSALVQSAVAHATSARIAPLRARDLVLLDPRGHGYSEPQMCAGLDALDQATLALDPSAERAYHAALLRRLTGR